MQKIGAAKSVTYRATERGPGGREQIDPESQAQRGLIPSIASRSGGLIKQTNSTFSKLNS